MATAEHKLTTGVHAPSTRLLHPYSQLLTCLAEQINDPRVRMLLETTEPLHIRLAATFWATAGWEPDMLNYDGKFNPKGWICKKRGELRVIFDEESGGTTYKTTIATMLRKMEDRGLVVHRTEGRKFIYRAKVSEENVKSSMVGQLSQRLFRGNVAAFASYLIAENKIDADELSELRKLVAEKAGDGDEENST